MKDSRAIKLDITDKESLYYALKLGLLKQFVNIVKESKSTSKELMLCFRTSKEKESVSIYYNNHQVWKLYVSKGIPYVEISGNHARDSENWETILENIGVSKEEIEKKKKSGKEINFKTILFSGNQIDEHFAQRTLPFIINMIEDFMDITKTYDYFKRDNHRRSNRVVGKKDLEEKRQQQLFYLQNHMFQNGLFVYDMEFAQEYENEIMKEAELKKMGITSSNQTDCLGIRFDKDGKPVSLVYIEIKSKESSVTEPPVSERSIQKALAEGKKPKPSSGLREHLKRMNAYLTIPEGESIEDTHIIDRVDEAKEMLECYRALGLRNIPNEFDVNSLDVLKALSKQEILLVFTGEEEGGAIHYFFRKGRNNAVKWIAPYRNKEYHLNWWPDLM